MRLAGFDWDVGNTSKCQKHGVSRDEIEAIFRGGGAVVSPDVRHSDTEERHLAIGRTTGGRYVFVAFTLRVKDGATYLRPISARYMHHKEVARHVQENPGPPNG